jgi:hypothetical protein
VSYTCMFPEDQCSGFWRLQTYEEALSVKMRHRSSDKSSPWKTTGIPGNSKSPWIFRRRFASSENARKSLDRILMRLDAEPYEIIHEGQGKGFRIHRPSVSDNHAKLHPLLASNRQCRSSKKEAA